ncbi:translation elongation factor Ts [Patescibacteria group bacterium]|nr:translation elongation factor Ts [Patescibacteria group bacterium]
MPKASLQQIKELRERTGISIIECQKALEEADGDTEKARTLLREWGKEVAEKKQAREVQEGAIGSYIHATGKVGALIDVGCETDFVVKLDDFKNLVHELAMQVASMNPGNVEELLEQSYIKDSSKSIKDLIAEVIAKVGENIVVQRFERFEI